jgi:hypothetical protein
VSALALSCTASAGRASRRCRPSPRSLPRPCS